MSTTDSTPLVELMNKQLDQVSGGSSFVVFYQNGNAYKFTGSNEHGNSNGTANAISHMKTS